MTKKQFNDTRQWQKRTFQGATFENKIYKLKEEIKELESASNIENITEEIADCFICMVGAADIAGISYEDLTHAIDKKMAINRARQWGTPDENGVYKHIKKQDHASK